ncbi:ABC transporter permease [Paenibacillus nasutitermitis]|uniref:Sugar ABC transporter permease n=1 Tax=Paenibacillus nasutitermitis TaxID=1652958 RepID=A0A916ZCK7_9BACL|nr:ABC transporter permease subunit [Paenibacillus nasutitermitis]GGD88273.1 sugar ABC transporter permease [Paenibacillus nasutitermitis]
MKSLLFTLRKQWQFHVLLIPAVVVIFIFNYIPLYGLVIAFQRYNPSMGFKSPWVGLDNFIRVFSQPNFVQTIWNTLFIAGFQIIGGIIVPVVFSLLLNEVRKVSAKRVFQTVIYLPYFLSWVILAGVMIDILSRGGIMNTFLSLFDIGPISFLGDPKTFRWTMIVSEIWKSFGFGTVIFLAALTSIDPGLYESAIVDGAKRWKQTWYITIPSIMPIIVLMTILSLGNVLNAGFDQIYNLYSPIVYSTGDIIDTYVYRLGIQQAQYSVGTAVGMFKALIAAFMILMSYYLADRFAGYRVL